MEPRPADTKFYVLLVDVIGSSQMADRAALTDQLQALQTRINGQNQSFLYAPLEITRGDEMAAVLESVSPIYDILSEIDDALYPVRFRSVVAYDRLTAGLGSRRSSILDGPAFYTAHDRMRELKRSKQTFALSSGHDGFNGPAEVLVNMLQWRWSQMTELQRKIARLYQVEGNQLKVGELLGRSQQQISHSLIATNWELLKASESTIRDVFANIDLFNGTAITAGEIAAGEQRTAAAG